MDLELCQQRRGRVSCSFRALLGSHQMWTTWKSARRLLYNSVCAFVSHHSVTTPDVYWALLFKPSLSHHCVTTLSALCPHHQAQDSARAYCD